MPTTTDSITTPDGICPVALSVPDGDGPWPAIVMYPDAGGVRSAIGEMAARLSSLGYAVLLPDVYYRHPDWAPFDMTTVFGDDAERRRLFMLMKGITPEMMATDARAFFDYLAARPEVTGDRFGIVGYCMGGRTALVVAGRVPHRVAAAMSFHGGGLVAESDSPHRMAGQMRAAVYVGAAEDDPSYTAEQSATLDTALSDAGVEHVIEWYPAAHGFAVPDITTYDADAAARHWAAIGAFMPRYLRC